jgi:Ca2+-binding RTX toxin-like protein
MGNDTLDGGAGNDQLFGDVQNFSMSVINGTGLGTGCYSSNSSIRFGNDTLIGRAGNDILVGDIANPSQLTPFVSFGVDPNSGPFGPNPNTITFANDTFQFSLAGNNGNDTVKDMNVGGVNDTLKFTGATDVNHDSVLDFQDVDAVVTFSNNGGHEQMNFNAGGSVLFENIAYSSLIHSVHDITPISS